MNPPGTATGGKAGSTVIALLYQASLRSVEGGKGSAKAVDKIFAKKLVIRFLFATIGAWQLRDGKKK
jgi:hypothetical protein